MPDDASAGAIWVVSAGLLLFTQPEGLCVGEMTTEFFKIWRPKRPLGGWLSYDLAAGGALA